ncbi:MAG: hypothetical protein ACXWZL_06285 [Mycobacterium sp.]
MARTFPSRLKGSPVTRPPNAAPFEGGVRQVALTARCSLQR